MSFINIHSLSPQPYHTFGTPDYPSDGKLSINDWFPNLSYCLDQFKSQAPSQMLSSEKPVCTPLMPSQIQSPEKPISCRITPSQMISSEKPICTPLMPSQIQSLEKPLGSPNKRRRTPQKNFSFKKISTSSWFFVPNENHLEDCKKTVYAFLSDCTDAQARYIYKFFRDKTRNIVATGPFKRPSLICNAIDEQQVLFVPKILFETISSTTRKSDLRRLKNIKFSTSPDIHNELLTTIYPIALLQVQRNMNPR